MMVSVIRKKVINHLMCNLEIKIPAGDSKEDQDTIEKLEESLNKIRHFAEEGLIVANGDGYLVTPLGQLFLRNIAMPFDRYLSRESAATFSKTI